MSSNDIALRVENLGKMYRLGHERPKASGLAGKVKQGLGAPFEWLASQMRPPSEEETLWALKDVSFEIKRGEVVGFIGHNGAGKSTLLKILSRITEPTEGFAEINGRIAALLEVGTGMHPELTGRENIYMNGTVLGMKKKEIDRKLDEIIDFSGIEKFLDTPVKRYSSGMRVRLGFAIAAHLEPEILVVDEVLAVGDLDFQKKCLGKMENVASDGRTVLFVSHNMPAITKLCTRVIVLQYGKIVYDGPSDKAVGFYYRMGQEEDSATDLAAAPREGDLGRELRISGLQCGLDIARSGDAVTGQPFYFTANVNKENDLNYTGISLTISVFNDAGAFLFACRSDSLGKTYDVTDRCTSFTLKIPKLPLNGGSYYVTVNISTPTTMYDKVADALSFRVAEGDYYGTGRLPGRARNGVLIDYEWL